MGDGNNTTVTEALSVMLLVGGLACSLAWEAVGGRSGDARESLGGLVRDGRGLSVSVRRTDQYVLDSLGRGGPGRARILAVSVRRTDRTFVEPDRVE